ncbi:MAG TPA: PQQ-binding-like beta-propeller repeat protein [Tepidisphaeraceae bacterium]|nr:PQQ-binding-like beta-propeller repeat protein [Tepidisphaeraceae bacterium]
MPTITGRGVLCARAAVVAVLLLWALRALGDEWPEWRGVGRSAVWDEKGVMASFPPGGLTVTWRAAVGRGWSSPVVAGGRVFLTDVEVAGAKATERVLCFDERSGEVLWTHAYGVGYPDWALGPDGGGPRATPVVRDGRLYTLGALGHLFCLDAAGGGVVWAKDLAKELQVKEFTGITASPLVEGELLILQASAKPGACVVAFDRRSGREVWRALDDSFTYSSPIVFTAGGKRQLVVWTQEAVTSLDPATGRTRWREPLRTSGDAAVATPVQVGERLLVGGLMMRLDPDKPAATVLWPEDKALKPRILSNTSTALVRGECVFSARTTGELVCLEWGTGRELWQVEGVTAPGNGAGIHLVWNGDSVLAFTDQGDLVRARMSSKGYEELGRAHLLDGTYSFNGSKRAWAMPAFANRHVFARNDRELVCADLTAATRE